MSWQRGSLELTVARFDPTPNIVSNLRIPPPDPTFVPHALLSSKDPVVYTQLLKALRFAP